MFRSCFNRRFVATWIGVCLSMAFGIRPATAAKNDPVPHEQIPGKWKDAKGTTVTIDTDEKGDFRLARDGVLWEQLIPYRPGPLSSLVFKHTPTIDELPEDMPKEIKDAAITAALEWRIRFTRIVTGYRVLGNRCRLYMEGEFLPGIVKWDTVTDQNTGTKNVFISAKIGGPAKPIELKQILYELPGMGQWLQINEHLDSSSAGAGLGEIASLPLEAQSYTYLGNLDAAILEGMYTGLTLNLPIEGVGKYAIKLFKGLTKKKLEGADTSEAVLDTLGKMVGSEILKGLLPKNSVPEDLKPYANKIIDKVAGELIKKGETLSDERLFSDEEAKHFQEYFQDTCRFKFVQLELYNNKAVNLGLVIIDTKAGNAHFIFVAPRRKLGGGEYPGAVLSGDIPLPEAGQRPKSTILNLSLTWMP